MGISEVEARIDKQKFTDEEMDEINELLETYHGIESEYQDAPDHEKSQLKQIQGDALNQLCQIVQTVDEEEAERWAENHIKEPQAF